MNWIKTNWTILAALAAMSAAWGEQTIRVQGMERSIEQQAAENKEQRIVREQVIRQDEKLKSIERSQQTTEQLMRDILQGQRSIERKVSK